MLTRRPLILGALAAWLPWSAACAQEAAPGAFAGEWNGVLEAGSQRLRLRLVVREGGADLYSLDQGEDAIPANSVRVEGDRLRLRFPSINASYEGRLVNGRIDGVFTQGARLPLVFARGEVQAAPVQPLTIERLRALRAEAGAPALAAAAAHRDGRRLDLADGVRVQGRSEQVTTQDVWHLGSITKSMTSTLVARCVEAGAVSWDDTVGAVLAGAIADMRPEYRDANFRHLLSHRAGLQANLPITDFVRYRRENEDPREERVAFARQALRQEPIGPKEQSFLYSNNGYVIAGAMLEAKLGASWETLIRRHVFEPLGMASAGFGAPGARAAYDQPAGHAGGLVGGLRPHLPGDAITDNPAVLGPAGRVHAAFDDVLKYLAAHRDGAAFLNAESWRTLHTPPFGGDYAMGWVKRGDALWHNGSNTLWYAEVTFDRTSGVAAVAAANDGRLQRVTPAVGSALAGAAAAVQTG
ncbi:MAG TPA: serine hydrolase domain-containing protein [Vitreimonas sp.]|uniref:serine hydrolase domain-containing protein n=1 Tax=Vitreimonas sp. TaxID=3069702 RepID=UPI002D6AC7F1|nr:serine hydrolase domain-containing protein [Vitreimonas sp.]HYD86631.1 serine hydrolase domain-containing protein [Vitreimonas sp.]